MSQDLNFIRNSLGLHLFWARIMKEHLLFLQLGLTAKQVLLARQARLLRLQFDRLLSQTVLLANGVLEPDLLQAQEILTPFTLEAELATQSRTGIRINTNITRRERNLISNSGTPSPLLTQQVIRLNRRAQPLIAAIIRYKQRVLTKVINCKIFGNNYPLLIDHILREAQLYQILLAQLQRNQIDPESTETTTFWNRIMEEHAKFIRGLLDPTEAELIRTAHGFAKLFEEGPADPLEATVALRDFKAQSTQGLIACQIQAIITPLLGDHVLREANHYVRLLTTLSPCQANTF